VPFPFVEGRPTLHFPLIYFFSGMGFRSRDAEFMQ
jgi:hypothetical protein